jgi:hypothetical protein
MKTLLTLVLVAAFSFSSDAQVKSLVGKWTYVDFSVNVRPEKKEKVDQFFRDMAIEFNEDMTYSALLMGAEEKGKWEISEDEKTITLVSKRNGEEMVQKVALETLKPEEIVLNFGYGGFIMKKEKKEK